MRGDPAPPRIAYKTWSQDGRHDPLPPQRFRRRIVNFYGSLKAGWKKGIGSPHPGRLFRVRLPLHTEG
jgi:hypothetical protein